MAKNNITNNILENATFYWFIMLRLTYYMFYTTINILIQEDIKIIHVEKEKL